MTISEHKNRIGKFIFYSNLTLFGLILIYYFLSGFTDSEFLDIIKLLAPIKAVYLTAVIKYVISNQDTNIIQNKKQVKKLYKTVTSIMIYCHILSLIIVISLFSLFKLFEFNSLKNIISVLETFFGLYVGFILSDMFSIEKKNEQIKDSISDNKNTLP